MGIVTFLSSTVTAIQSMACQNWKGLWLLSACRTQCWFQRSWGKHMKRLPIAWWGDVAHQVQLIAVRVAKCGGRRVGDYVCRPCGRVWGSDKCLMMFSTMSDYRRGRKDSICHGLLLDHRLGTHYDLCRYKVKYGQHGVRVILVQCLRKDPVGELNSDYERSPSKSAWSNLYIWLFEIAVGYRVGYHEAALVENGRKSALTDENWGWRDERESWSIRSMSLSRGGRRQANTRNLDRRSFVT